MSEQSLTNKVLSGTIWSFFESFFRQIITFLLGLVLARLLFPSDYGLIGMLQFFLAICQSVVDCGFSNALICKSNRNDNDFSTAFYFNLLIGIVCYALLFLIAPFVSDFYKEPQLIPLLRVVGLTVFFNSLCIVQNAILTSSLKMKLLTRVTVISHTISGLVGIVCAYLGFGVWSLAIQSVGATILTTILLWNVTKWKPIRSFSKESFKYLWGFGSKMLFVGITSTAYSNMHSLIIGKTFNKTDLGIYTKANSFSRLIPNTIYTVLNKVSLPTFTEISDDQVRLKAAFRKYMRIASFGVFPIMGFIFMFAKPIVIFLWTDKWADAISAIRIICIGCMWNTLTLLSISLIQVFHKPDVLLKYEITNKVIGLVILIITLPFGFYAVIAGRSVYNIYEYLSYTRTNKHLLKYKFGEQFTDSVPNFILMLVCMSAAYFLSSGISTNFLRILFGGIVGFGFYIITSKLINSQSYRDLTDIMLKFRKK